MRAGCLPPVLVAAPPSRAHPRFASPPRSRAFPVALGCLTTLAQVKCCLLLLDLESDELLVDYVRELTRVVNEHNSGHLPATVVAVLVPLIEESEGLSQELTEALLGPLVPPLATRGA